MTKRNQNQTQEEILRELIREANGAVKDMRQTIRDLKDAESQAREFLPGLVDEGIKARINAELDEAFEDDVNKKLREVYVYLDDMVEAITEGTVGHFAQLISLLFKVLASMNRYNPREMNLRPIDILGDLLAVVNAQREPVNNDIYGFFNTDVQDISKGYRKGKS